MIKIGTNRIEAINWVQDHLGPVTPRNIAEDTFKALIHEGLIETALDEVVLIEDIDQDGLRRRARNTMITKDHRGIRRGPRCAPQRPQIHEGHRRVHHHQHLYNNVIAQGDHNTLSILSYDETPPDQDKDK